MRVLVIGHTCVTRFAQAKYEALTRLYPDVSVTGLVPRRWEKGIIDRVAAGPVGAGGACQELPVREHTAGGVK